MNYSAFLFFGLFYLCQCWRSCWAAQKLYFLCSEGCLVSGSQQLLLQPLWEQPLLLALLSVLQPLYFSADGESVKNYSYLHQSWNKRLKQKDPQSGKCFTSTPILFDMIGLIYILRNNISKYASNRLPRQTLSRKRKWDNFVSLWLCKDTETVSEFSLNKQNIVYQHM